MLNIEKLFEAMKQIGTAVIANSPAVFETLNAAISVIKEDDQDEAKSVLADLVAERPEGFERLQAKLNEAAQRT